MVPSEKIICVTVDNKSCGFLKYIVLVAAAPHFLLRFTLQCTVQGSLYAGKKRLCLS